jgi:putative membrane protein
MAESLFRTLHLLGVMGTAAGLLIIVFGASQVVSKDDASGIFKVYLMTGVAILITLIAGLSLWLYVGKPAAFFSGNPVFHAKLGLFIILLTVLAYPFRYFAKVSSATGGMSGPITIPLGVQRLQKAAIPLLLVMPVLAYLMARGVGY